MEELVRGQGGFRVTEDRGEEEEGHPGANELTLSPHVDQGLRLNSKYACKMNAKTNAETLAYSPLA